MPNNLYCYHFDATGHTVALTNATKTRVNKYAYTPFGVITGQTETIPQPFKYAGQHGVMAESHGLYYMRARFYDPAVKRFISEDPLGFDGGDLNLYAYCGNSPVMGVDPSGLCWEGFKLDAVGIGSSLAGLFADYIKLPDTKTEAMIWGVDVINNKLGIVSSFLPDSYAKNNADIVLGIVGTGAAIAGDSPALTFLAGYQLGSAINKIEISNSNVQNKLSDFLFGR